MRTGGTLDFTGPWIAIGAGLAGGIPGAPTAGELRIERGGTANVGGFIALGNVANSTQSVNVSGPGGALNIDPGGPGQALTLNSDGQSSVLVENGGVLTTVNGALSLGAGPGSQHAVTVRDPRRRIDLGNGLLSAVGNGGDASLSFTGGSVGNVVADIAGAGTSVEGFGVFVGNTGSAAAGAGGAGDVGRPAVCGRLRCRRRQLALIG